MLRVVQFHDLTADRWLEGAIVVCTCMSVMLHAAEMPRLIVHGRSGSVAFVRVAVKLPSAARRDASLLLPRSMAVPDRLNAVADMM